MQFTKKTTKRNIYPNKYRIFYQDYKNNYKSATMSGLTSHEAINRFRSKNMDAKNVTARLIRKN